MSQINKPVAPLVPGGVDPEVLDAKADLVNGEVPSEQLPSYVDDVLEFDSVEDFPEEGESGKIYVDLETNYTYRWSGSAYIQIGGGSGGVEINDYSTTPEEIVGRIKINGVNYEVEDGNPFLLSVEVDTTKPETRITKKDFDSFLAQSYNNEIPPYDVPCYLNIYFDGDNLPLIFTHLAIGVDEEAGVTDISFYTPSGEYYLDYDAEAEAFLSDQIIMPSSVEAGLAEYLKQQTGSPVEVEEIHDLWLPSQNRFVKFAGGNTPRNTLEFYFPDNWDGDFAQLLQEQDYELLQAIVDSSFNQETFESIPVVCFDQKGNRYEITATSRNSADIRIEPNLADRPVSDFGGDTTALIYGSFSIETDPDSEMGDVFISANINGSTRYATIADTEKVIKHINISTFDRLLSINHVEITYIAGYDSTVIFEGTADEYAEWSASQYGLSTSTFISQLDYVNIFFAPKERDELGVYCRLDNADTGDMIPGSQYIMNTYVPAAEDSGNMAIISLINDTIPDTVSSVNLKINFHYGELPE